MDENPMSWVDAVERIGVSGVLLTILVLVGRYYLAPLFQSHMNLVTRLSEAIDSQERVQETQTKLLEEIVKEEHEEKRLMIEVKNELGNLARRNPDSQQ